MQAMHSELRAPHPSTALWRARLWLAGERFTCWIEAGAHVSLALERPRTARLAGHRATELRRGAL